jgi:transcriptional antiterminator/mannitol/fructose-specific phosphotransferase system IIA component (Ntr-type)
VQTDSIERLVDFTNNESEENKMRKREKQIVLMLLHQNGVFFDQVLENFGISRRTLYYDIKKINETLYEIGSIIKQRKQLYLEGNHKLISFTVQVESDDNLEKYLEYKERKKFILRKVFSNVTIDVSTLAKEMYVSEGTIALTIKQLKEELQVDSVRLFYDNGYKIKGSERSIRDLFLMYFAEPSIEIEIDERVEEFNDKSNLDLADFSKSILTRFLTFLQMRIEKERYIEDLTVFHDAEEFPYYEYIGILCDSLIYKEEIRYVAAFVSSLSSLNPYVDEEKIHTFVEQLLFSIENNLLIIIDNKEELKSGIIRHLYSSYNRIKYQFPIYNPLLEEIKLRFESLFRITKNLFLEKHFIPALSMIREEEIAFIVSYLGAYISKNRLNKMNPRVLIVCSNGITMSKTIEYQLEQYFPQIEIVNTVPASKIKDIQQDYDYIISTVEIKQEENVIVVNPILRNVDLDEIGVKIYQRGSRQNKINIGNLLDIIREYADIKNEEKLEKALYDSIYKMNKQRGGTYMLEDLLVKENIRIDTNSYTWEEAIKEAAKPLLEKELIEDSYVEAMIRSVKENGPYIVIDEYIALAHARPKDGVNELSMSMLKVDKSIDFLGEEVMVVVVLAATDNTKHIHALASLTELFMEEESKEMIIKATEIEEIHKLIKKYS